MKRCAVRAFQVRPWATWVLVLASRGPGCTNSLPLALSSSALATAKSALKLEISRRCPAPHTHKLVHPHPLPCSFLTPTSHLRLVYPPNYLSSYLENTPSPAASSRQPLSPLQPPIRKQIEHTRSIDQSHSHHRLFLPQRTNLPKWQNEMAPMKTLNSNHSSSNYGENIARQANVLASCYIVDAAASLKGFHYCTTLAAGKTK